MKGVVPSREVEEQGARLDLPRVRRKRGGAALREEAGRTTRGGAHSKGGDDGKEAGCQHFEKSLRYSTSTVLTQLLCPHLVGLDGH